MKNKLSDLNNHLFEQLERLNDESLKGEKLAAEIIRAEAIARIAVQLIANGTLALRSYIAVETSRGSARLPAMLDV